ncbi:hypothetical protein AADZ90_003780 [Aestuariibius sp. 2305UL40-4]|uniref:hypothetical protein n=1 Tax=Aestuariibius violaceus TaxID=3234132 RepID=UPI00345E8E63
MFALMASPAAANFDPPAGCEALVTIQQKDCTVSNHFVCEADPEGSRRRADFNEDGLTYAGMIDDETQWVESFDPFSGAVDRLVEADDPASFSDLLEEGEDAFDFVTMSSYGERVRYVGSDRLLGEEVEIDGVTLDRTAYEIEAFDEDGELLWESAGEEYIHRNWRAFIAGMSTSSGGSGDPITEDSSPVEFIFPGEVGFFSSSPKYGCGAELIRFEP